MENFILAAFAIIALIAFSRTMISNSLSVKRTKADSGVPLGYPPNKYAVKQKYENALSQSAIPAATVVLSSAIDEDECFSSNSMDFNDSFSDGLYGDFNGGIDMFNNLPHNLEPIESKCIITDIEYHYMPGNIYNPETYSSQSIDDSLGSTASIEDSFISTSNFDDSFGSISSIDDSMSSFSSFDDSFESSSSFDDW